MELITKSFEGKKGRFTMKGKMKKLVAFALAAIMVLAMGITVSAKDVNCGTGDATITINNASKGETYKIYKLFDATVTGDENGSIIYTGIIPESLEDYFVKDAAGNIRATDKAVADDGETVSANLQDELTKWTETAAATAQGESDGSALIFKGLAYGYYVVTTSQGNHALTVASTNPVASVYDKNSTVPTVPEDGKKVDNDNVSIGDTVTYTLKFTTSNYDGEGTDAKKILSYTVTDTLPAWLENVEVTAITIKGGNSDGSDLDYKENGLTPPFNALGKINIPWVAEDTKDSLYKNGTIVEITYTATVGSTNITIDGDGNPNTFTLTYTTADGEKTPDPDQSTSTEIIYTYALAIKKVDQAGKALPGATFRVEGLQTEGTDGVYTVKGSTPQGEEDTVMTTDAEGILIIKGVKAGTYSVWEVEAPQGYNKLETATTVEAVKTSETSTTYTKYLDSQGNVTSEVTDAVVEYNNGDLSATVLPVVNMSGTVLPSTGGIGTTIFYVVGGLLVAGAGILLITKKRMKKEQ